MRTTSGGNAVQIWFRRVLVASAAVLTLPAMTTVVGNAPSANAFSREGLPVEAGGRNATFQFLSAGSDQILVP